MMSGLAAMHQHSVTDLAGKLLQLELLILDKSAPQGELAF